MNNNRILIKILLIVLLSLLAVPTAFGGNVKQGDKITIVTPGTVARLCPSPNCGQNQHITRIPENTKLEIEGIMNVKTGLMEVMWFEVTYKGKRGWISMYDTNKAQ